MIKHRLDFLQIALVVFITIASATTAFCDEPSATITIRPDIKYQTLEGFGASGAWWAQAIGQWPDEPRSRIIELLFSKEQGIGLNIYRYNIGAGSEHPYRIPWRATESFYLAPGEYDWSRDAAAMRILREAVEAGVDHVVLFANSPPAPLTISGSSAGGLHGESNLRPDAVEPYTEFLVAVSQRFILQEQLPVRSISPINEPQWDWQPGKSQEGCHYEPDQCVPVIRSLIRKLQQAELPVEVETPESGEWKGRAGEYADALFTDPLITEHLDSYAVHSYWSEPEDKRRLQQYMIKKHPGKKIKMTEWCEMKGGRDTSMDSALTLARTVHDDLTIGQAVCWQYWIAVSPYNFRDGLLYVPLLNNMRRSGTRGTTQSPPEPDYLITETKRLWALGNWSRFLDAGSIRIDAQCPDSHLKVSAYLSADSNQTVVVCINPTDHEVSTRINITGHRPTSWSVYETSDEHSLKPVLQCKQPDQFGQYRFPARSVTTLVIE